MQSAKRTYRTLFFLWCDRPHTRKKPGFLKFWLTLEVFGRNPVSDFETIAIE